MSLNSPDTYVPAPATPPANPVDGGIGNSKRTRHRVEMDRRRKEIALRASVDSYGPSDDRNGEHIIARARKLEAYLKEGDDDN